MSYHLTPLPCEKKKEKMEKNYDSRSKCGRFHSDSGDSCSSVITSNILLSVGYVKTLLKPDWMCLLRLNADVTDRKLKFVLFECLHPWLHIFATVSLSTQYYFILRCFSKMMSKMPYRWHKSILQTNLFFVVPLHQWQYQVLMKHLLHLTETYTVNNTLSQVLIMQILSVLILDLPP